MGRYFWNQRTAPSFQKSIEYFQAALEKDPNYALAYSGLADCHGLRGAYMVVPAAKVAAQKAITLDDQLAEPHNSLALSLWLYDWDWQRADAEFRRAIELNPGSVTAHHWRGLFLGEMGRFDEAVGEMQQALSYDPISAPVLADLGRIYFWARRYDLALEKYHKAREVNPNFGAYRIEADQLYEQVAVAKDYLSYQKLGWFMGEDQSVYLERASKASRRRQIHDETISKRIGAAYTRAELYAQIGEIDKAITELNEAVLEKDHRLSQLKVNPKLDSLRADPRFEKLLRQLNLL